jgi:hypothetical protein
MGVYIDSKIIRKFNTRVDDVLERKCALCWFKFYGEQNPKETSLKQFCFNYNLSEDDINWNFTKDLRRNIK